MILLRDFLRRPGRRRPLGLRSRKARSDIAWPSAGRVRPAESAFPATVRPEARTAKANTPCHGVFPLCRLPASFLWQAFGSNRMFKKKKKKNPEGDCAAGKCNASGACISANHGCPPPGDKLTGTFCCTKSFQGGRQAARRCSRPPSGDRAAAEAASEEAAAAAATATQSSRKVCSTWKESPMLRLPLPAEFADPAKS